MDNFQAYGEFARVYDMFQDNVDYETWSEWLKNRLKEYGISDLKRRESPMDLCWILAAAQEP